MATEAHVIPASGGREELVIYGETANINYFLNSPLTPASLAAVSNKTTSVKAHTRRQYPGDQSAINVGQTAREYMDDPGRRSGRGLPGRTITLISEYGLPNQEIRQFTLKGRWMDFHSWLSTEAKYQTRMVNNTGAWTVVDAANP